jgi:hypothetical protein
MRTQFFGPKAYKLDTANAGCDEILFGENKSQVLADVLHHHDCEALPSDWSIEETEISIADMRTVAPWASEIIEVDGGFMAFESMDDYNTWSGQSDPCQDDSMNTFPIGGNGTVSEINEDSEAYNTGYEASIQHEPRTANPYASGTWESDNWFAGWDAK